MFATIQHKVARLLAIAALALMASGLPLVQIALASDCAGSAACGG